MICGIVGRPLDTVIGAVIGVGPVAIVLAIGLVVLVAVADEILQCETVMGGDEIDARPRPPAAISEDVGGAGHARGEIGDEPSVALPKAPDGVAILPVPLGPAGRKIAELIAVRAEIPRFGNQFEPGHDRVLSDRIEERAALAIIAVFARRGVVHRSKRKPSTCISDAQ